jgi:hypothetical protein
VPRNQGLDVCMYAFFLLGAWGEVAGPHELAESTSGSSTFPCLGIRFGSFPSAEPAPSVASLLSCFGRDRLTCMGGWMSSFYARLRSEQIVCLSRFRLLSLSTLIRLVSICRYMYMYM